MTFQTLCFSLGDFLGVLKFLEEDVIDEFGV